MVGHAATLVGATIACLNLTAGVLFVARRRPSKMAPLRDWALCLGSVVMSGVALKVAPAFPAWPPAIAAVFAVAGAGAILSLVFLGTSFGVFPALRGLVERGPFRLIRHPIYACEMVMVASCSAAGGSLSSWWPTLLALALVVLRVHIEERLLRADPRHAIYRQRVRWRLLPGIW